jgi:hypothetical protein
MVRQGFDGPDFFGQDTAAYTGTGAPGTEGGQVTASRGDLATVQVTPPDGRFYAAVTAPVDRADTSGMSSDSPNRLWVSGGEQVSASWSSGSGHVSNPGNPNAAGA